LNLEEHPACSICLGDRPNLRAQCSHYFHPNCLRMWLKKKFECGVCRGTDLSLFRLSCSRCFGSVTQIPIAELIKLKRSYDKLACPDCL
jgi:hypothetical protein